MRLDLLRTRSAAASLCIVLAFAPIEAQHAESESSLQNTPNPVRKICDPHTGLQWILERDPSNQGGPGRMVLVNNTSCLHISATAEQDAASRNPSSGRKQATIHSAKVVIRAGDKLVLEENTPRVETRLEAVALSSAAVGAEFTARLSFQGAIVRAVAVEPGRASFSQASGMPRRP